MNNHRRHLVKEKNMRVAPMGDYYEWYCDWCDSKNLTLWIRFERGEVVCGACQKRLSMPTRSAEASRGVCREIL